MCQENTVGTWHDGDVIMYVSDIQSSVIIIQQKQNSAPLKSGGSWLTSPNSCEPSGKFTAISSQKGLWVISCLHLHQSIIKAMHERLLYKYRVCTSTRVRYELVASRTVSLVVPTLYSCSTQCLSTSSRTTLAEVRTAECTTTY
jgi:hypothetical protein